MMITAMFKLRVEIYPGSDFKLPGNPISATKISRLMTMVRQFDQLTKLTHLVLFGLSTDLDP